MKIDNSSYLMNFFYKLIRILNTYLIIFLKNITKHLEWIRKSLRTRTFTNGKYSVLTRMQNTSLEKQKREIKISGQARKENMFFYLSLIPRWRYITRGLETFPNPKLRMDPTIKYNGWSSSGGTGAMLTWGKILLSFPPPSSSLITMLILKKHFF